MAAGSSIALPPSFTTTVCPRNRASRETAEAKASADRPDTGSGIEGDSTRCAKSEKSMVCGRKKVVNGRRPIVGNCLDFFIEKFEPEAAYFSPMLSNHFPPPSVVHLRYNKGNVASFRVVNVLAERFKWTSTQAFEDVAMCFGLLQPFFSPGCCLVLRFCPL